VDFIFGSSVAIFERCIIYAKSRTSAGASYITAANTPPGQAFGFIFHNAKIPTNTGPPSTTWAAPGRTRPAACP
jgi:pectin methylesterase-like acyl-CoA thioesterase